MAGATARAMARGAAPAARGVAVGAAASFEATYGFAFDPFQRRALQALEDGRSVLVAAPTGAGKTVVGEFAAWLARIRGERCFYTTPIKALSNQKFADFSALYGPDGAGLLTGDNSVNPGAPVVVMTTEVLRNMLYEDSPLLDTLGFVVLDEVHYLQDRYRGAVWEEVLIHLPVDVQVVSLSATVSNAEEFAEWLETLRGPTEVIIEEHRPVEIRHWYFASDELLPMFVHRPDGEVVPNPKGREFERRRRQRSRPAPGEERRRKRARTPLRSEVIERLESEGMLPAIYFIFSRKGCDDAVRQVLRDGVRLTTPEERAQIAAFAEARSVELDLDELAVLGYDDWLAGLLAGFAAHHAGMIPLFKETVEQLFARGLIKVVFATETLALGINMPARTVVIENLTKFTGEKHELMTPGEYTQLSGRAGRRGLDELGHCVVLIQRFTPFDAITRLASTRTFPLRSSFSPSYNMAVNLVRNYDRGEADHLVNSSFAQFQADRDVVKLERTRERSEAYLASYRERMVCHLGDLNEYRALLERLKALERGGRGGGRVAEALAALAPGDVVDVAGGKRRGRYIVLEVHRARPQSGLKVLALSAERTLVRFAPADLKAPPRVLGRLRLPQGFRLRDVRARRELARALEAFEPSSRPSTEPFEPPGGDEGRETGALLAALEAHPCHTCPERNRHLHFAERAARLEREIAALDKRIARRTGTLARRFERVLAVLEDFGYVRGWSLTDKGELLSGVYNEADLLVVESLTSGLYDDLDPPDAAAALSTLVYEARGPDTPPPEPFPSAASARAHAALLRLYNRIQEAEQEHGLELTRPPDPGFAARAHRWASGAPLEEVIGPDDAPGDFVRTIKQLDDLVRQLADVAPSAELTATFDDVHAALWRGVVAHTPLEL